MNKIKEELNSPNGPKTNGETEILIKSLPDKKNNSMPRWIHYRILTDIQRFTGNNSSNIKKRNRRSILKRLL